jgi:hypothetical protein
MKDSEIRGIVLRAFYERRGEGSRIWSPSDAPDVATKDFYRIVEQLSEQNLINWHGLENGSGIVYAGNGEINVNGSDVIEGNITSPVSITFDHSNTVNVSNSTGVQIGDDNSLSQMTIEEINVEIDNPNFSAVEKAEAKSALSKFLEHRVRAAIWGGLASTVK